MYTLYYSPGSASMVVHLALLETGAPFRLVRIDFDKDEQHGRDYLRINPRGQVPTLIVDGKFMVSSGTAGTHERVPGALDAAIAVARAERPK